MANRKNMNAHLRTNQITPGIQVNGAVGNGGSQPPRKRMEAMAQMVRMNAEYRTTLESLISLASRAAELFERSKTEQKRQLIAFVFSNLQLRGKKLEFSLRCPHTN